MLNLQKIISAAIILPRLGKAWSAYSKNIMVPEGRISVCPHSPTVKTVTCHKVIGKKKNLKRLTQALESDTKIEDQAKQTKYTIILQSQFQLFL